jgi:predicted permease
MALNDAQEGTTIVIKLPPFLAKRSSRRSAVALALILVAVLVSAGISNSRERMIAFDTTLITKHVRDNSTDEVSEVVHVNQREAAQFIATYSSPEYRAIALESLELFFHRNLREKALYAVTTIGSNGLEKHLLFMMFTGVDGQRIIE